MPRYIIKHGVDLTLDDHTCELGGTESNYSRNCPYEGSHSYVTTSDSGTNRAACRSSCRCSNQPSSRSPYYSPGPRPQAAKQSSDSSSQYSHPDITAGCSRSGATDRGAHDHADDDGGKQLMTGRVNVFVRVVVNIRITVQRLWIIGPWDFSVGLNEPSNFRIVVTGLVVVEAGGFVEMLAGVAVGDGECGGAAPDAFEAKGGVFVLLDEHACAVHQDVGRAKVIAMVIVKDRVVHLGVDVGLGGCEDEGDDEPDGESLTPARNAECGTRNL